MKKFTRFPRVLHRLRRRLRLGKTGKTLARAVMMVVLIGGFLSAGVFLLWAATLNMPSLEAVETRRVEQSTKIYDRTGEILLYDLHQDIKRTVIPFDEMSRNIKNATVAIEDDRFYEHYGIEPTAIVRAVWSNLREGDLLGGQGGSTITQQVVKNSLLVREKTLSRKFKEWVLAIKLERIFSKEEILELYLNEVPYGGNKYGIEEASQGFFGKPASELSIAESAYLAALPQAPTYYSPYGNNREELEGRKNHVLDRMLSEGFITEEEHRFARDEDVLFLPQQDTGIRAPHFVFYVIQELRDMYTERELLEGGFRVITTLDMRLQTKAEEIVKRYALENEERFNARNAALVATDPKSGDILTMVGSRDYFDEELDGNFNVAIAHRQPGSSFKPFVYAAALNKGYTDQTVVFDVKTQFSTACQPSNLTSEGDCYSPVNYDGAFRGPVTFRNALAQSMNIPAIKVLYLAGLDNALEVARRMGITSLTNKSRYGLTLVLGGGEVSLLEMTGAYGVFANEGLKQERRAILRIEDHEENVIEDFTDELSQQRVLDTNIARMVTDMLADNAARTPAFGANSLLHFPGRDVAAKTGTTNEYRDAWIIGYTPSLAVGAWAGNNNNEAMEKRVAGFIIAPLWNEFMNAALQEYEAVERFTKPTPMATSDLKPILRGQWQGGSTQTLDQRTGLPATADTPEVFRRTVTIGGQVHSILHWVDRANPRGAPPQNPAADGQYRLWEYGVARWATGSGYQRSFGTTTPDGTFDPSGGGSQSGGQSSGDTGAITIRIVSPHENQEIEQDEPFAADVRIDSGEQLAEVLYYLDEELLERKERAPFSVTFTPEEHGISGGTHRLRVTAEDEGGNQAAYERVFRVE